MPKVLYPVTEQLFVKLNVIKRHVFAPSDHVSFKLMYTIYYLLKGNC